MPSKITRQYCPSVWHDAIADHYKRLAHIAPIAAAEYIAHKYGCERWHVPIIAAWCAAKVRRIPCPVV